MRAIRPILPSDARGEDGVPADRIGRRRHELVHLLPARVPPRVRRHRAVRRLVRHRELALDHDRPAHARARDAAHARRLTATGPPLDHHRGARRRRRSRPSSASSWGSSSRRCSSGSSTSSGFILPNTGLVFLTRTSVIAALAAGILVTLIASLRPAIRATRVPPIAAVREGSVLPPPKHRRLRGAGAVLMAVAGIAAIAYGIFAHGLGTKQVLTWMGARDAPHVHRGLALLVAARPSPCRRPRLARDRGPPARRGCSLGTTRVATRSGQRRLQLR